MSIVLDGSAGITFPSGNTQSNAALITSGGTIAGNLALGGNLTFNAGTNGITFNNTGATVNSSLNDYETGTWTPACYFNGSASSGQAGAFNGFYTKVGNSVVATGKIDLTNLGSGTGNFTIVGLPFSANSNSNFRTIGTMFWSSTSSSLITIVPLLSAGSTSIEILGSTSATNGLSDLTNSNLSNSTSLRFAISYITSF